MDVNELFDIINGKEQSPLEDMADGVDDFKDKLLELVKQSDVPDSIKEAVRRLPTPNAVIKQTEVISRDIHNELSKDGAWTCSIEGEAVSDDRTKVSVKVLKGDKSLEGGIDGQATRQERYHLFYMLLAIMRTTTNCVDNLDWVPDDIKEYYLTLMKQIVGVVAALQVADPELDAGANK